METQTLKFVIVGHVDHGKSTLIGRLLYDTDSLPPDKIEEVRRTSKELGKETEFAYLLDHLEEEREQGVTIDTTQVFFKTPKRQYVIIDAPGHIEFVKNMITGASQAEAGILIVDVKEGVKEQTQRHANILSMLDISQIIVALNKMDLVDYDKGRYEAVLAEARGFLSTIGLSADFYIPISAKNGDNVALVSKNIPWYKGPTILESLDSLRNKPLLEDKSLILPIQDVYKIDDKRIAVGRIEAGRLQERDKVIVLPERKETEVGSIEKFMEEVKSARAGESIGFTTKDAVFIDSGHVICKPGKEPPIVDTFKGNVFWMYKESFNKDERVTLRLATQEITCRITDIIKRMDSSSLEVIERNADILKNLEVGEVIIKTKKPIILQPFSELPPLGRFVLVKGENICAGGIVTGI